MARERVRFGLTPVTRHVPTRGTSESSLESVSKGQNHPTWPPPLRLLLSRTSSEKTRVRTGHARATSACAPCRQRALPESHTQFPLQTPLPLEHFAPLRLHPMLCPCSLSRPYIRHCRRDRHHLLFSWRYSRESSDSPLCAFLHKLGRACRKHHTIGVPLKSI